MTVAPDEVKHRLRTLAQDAGRGEDEWIAFQPELHCRRRTMGEEVGVGGRYGLEDVTGWREDAADGRGVRGIRPVSGRVGGAGREGVAGKGEGAGRVRVWAGWVQGAGAHPGRACDPLHEAAR